MITSITALTKEQIVEKLISILEIDTYLQKGEDGCFYDEIYADYTDTLQNDTIKKILESEHPRDKYYELLNSWYFDSDHEHYNEIFDIIKKHLNNDDICYCEHKDFIDDWVHENVYFNYPYDHYLKQNVCLNIMVDTGDANYDFTWNQLFGFYRDEDATLDDLQYSSLVWLMRQQGYSDVAIAKFIKNYDEQDNEQDSKLFASIYQECSNTTTAMNTLTFLVEMTLGEAINLHELLAAKNKGFLIIGKDTACGLYDPWNGAGGMLEINLEKDVKLPLNLIESALPDGCRGYGIDSIYGICRSFWKGNSVKIIKEED